MSNKRLKTITFPGLDDVYTIPDEAPEYSASATYKVGDFVVYGGALYKCNTAIESAEDWTAAHWTVTKMGNEVSGLQTAITQITEREITANFFDNRYTVAGFLVNGGTISTEGSYANYFTSDYIALTAGTYTISRYPIVSSRFPVCIYDTNKTYKSYSYSGSSENYVTFTLSANGYVRFSMPAKATTMLVSGSVAPSEYIPYGLEYLNSDIGITPKNDKRFEGIVIANIGDSIAEYREDSHNYASQFCDLTGAILTTDLAVSGSTMSYIVGQAMGSVVKQAEALVTNGTYSTQDYKIILVDGGANDLSENRTVGAVVKTNDYYAPEDYTAEFDQSNFIGAMEQTFKLLRNKWTSAIIVFVIPHKHGRYAGNWNAMIDGMHEVCDKWSIAVLDMYKDGELNTRIPAMITGYTDEGGTHPTTLGIKKFYLPKLVGLLNNYFVDDASV